MLFPSYPDGLFVYMMQNKFGDGPVTGALRKGIKASWRGSVEILILKALICTSFRAAQVASILENGVYNDGYSCDSVGTDPDCSTIPTKDSEGALDCHVTKKRRLGGGSQSAFLKGRTDWCVLMAAGSLCVPKWSREKCAEGKLKIFFPSYSEQSTTSPVLGLYSGSARW